MSEPNVPHFQPLTVSGQFPESDVRGAAAIEAESGRQTYLSWEEQQRLQEERLRMLKELDSLRTTQGVYRQLRRYMRTNSPDAAGEILVTDAADKVRRCNASFDILGLMIKVSDQTPKVAKTIEDERYAPTPVASPITPVVSPFTSAPSMEVMPGSPRPEEVVTIISAEPVAETTKPAMPGPIVTRSGRIVKPIKKFMN
ncbi:hypothetical protein PspLS_05669 [Pyricularia sp. CBS 133598]|nr:hypothetical protein PspLS_05669 [Pyricularia sp. CBS 133598]